MDRIQTFAKNIVIFFFLVITGYLSVSSFLINADMPLDGISERTVFHKNLYLLTLIFLIFILYMVCRFKERIASADTKKLVRCLIFYDFILCILWIVLCNTREGADQAQVLYAAKGFAEGNYEKLAYNQYMGMFPYQLPLALLYEPFYILFGDVTPFLWQLINAVLICAIQYLLYLIVRNWRTEKVVVNWYLLLQFGNLPLILYVSFIYGTIIGLFLALAALWFLLKYSTERKWKCLILSALCIACACLLRTNNVIVMIALIIVAVMSAMRSDKRLLILIPMFVLFFGCGRWSVCKFYEMRSGMKISDGVPAAMFIAMGLSDNTERAAGWYNGYNWDVYLELDCDNGAAGTFARDRIRESLSKFRSSPAYTWKFFLEKTHSTWLNPDLQGLWNNDHHGHYVARAPVVNNLFTGELHLLAETVLGNFQFLIYFGAFLFALCYGKRADWQHLSLAIIFIGGFLFHLFWETKAQYVIVYYILLFPYAAAGLFMLSEKLALKCREFFGK
ncbi:MAG: hypothetical protein NC313_15375 [Butyrivibrio sp.]|nr:hypothetical protein [Butyrivibrio sp.]